MCSISVEVAEGAMSLAQDRCRAEDEDCRSGCVGRVGSVGRSKAVFWKERRRACDKVPRKEAAAV